MIERYDRQILINNHEIYYNILREKNINFLRQFKTPVFTELNINEMAGVYFINHVWSYGDRYYKLAEKYFGDAKDWWIIARINKKPTESHVKVGDTIIVPVNLVDMLKYL